MGLVEVSGTLNKFIFRNEENGYSVADLVSNGKKSTLIVGMLPSVKEGEYISVKGEWVDHPRYGRQLKIADCFLTLPASISEMKMYLSSGIVKGIGAEIAVRVVDHFGTKTMDILENHIERLIEVKGIGPKNIEMMKTSWLEGKDIRNLVLFLQKYDIGASYATRIYRTYGKSSIDTIKSNPYRLADDIYGIGFATADVIAQKLGFKKNSTFRIEAGIKYALASSSMEGHVYLPREVLIKKAYELLEVKTGLINDTITFMGNNKVITNDNEKIYSNKFHFYETEIAKCITQLVNAYGGGRDISSLKNEIAEVQKALSITLASKQIDGVRSAFENKVSVLTGGPGTGKTTIINSILNIAQRFDMEVLLAAPTGRAAKRMSEVTGHEACTIHRLLEFSPMDGGFRRNKTNKLLCDMLIIDEASMLDIHLMYHLLLAIPDNASFILVGDIDQLPSVGPGNILNDIINSEIVPVIRLNEIFRQAAGSQIIVNAHKVNKGEFPITDNNIKGDFFYFSKEHESDIGSTVIELVKDRLPKTFGLNPVDDIQVLVPMYKGIVGIDQLNNKLQSVLNTSTEALQRGFVKYLVNDKVMQIRNNYDKDVFNGDIGIVEKVDLATKILSVRFDQKLVQYEQSDLDELVLAYAISIHKSQGSQFPCVVIPMTSKHYLLLQRNLLYTAITRGKKLVILIGEKKAVAMSVHNNKVRKRFTYLMERIRSK